MAQDSKRKRHLRRVKRGRTLAFRQLTTQQAQIQQLVGMVVKQRQELKELKPEPKFTITTLPDTFDGSGSAVDANTIYPSDPIAEVSDVLGPAEA